MVNFDSPILALGALFLAGQDQRGRRFTGGETGKGYLAGGFAGSSAEFAVNKLRNTAGVSESALSDELAQALLGAGVSRFGGMIPQNKAMARGIHYNVATQSFQDAGLSLGSLMNGDSTTTSSTSGSTTQARNVSRSRSVSSTHNTRNTGGSSGKVY